VKTLSTTVSDLTWFSGMCRRLIIIEGEGAVTEEESVYVFRAVDREAAITRFLELAREQDDVYPNGEGKQVRWVVVSLETVDELAEGPIGDREVFSKMTDIEPPDTSVSIDTQFTPEKSEPGWCGVAPW
jgi:hypothetical protein